MITEFNKAMEESGSKMERLKSTVMKEAKAMIASLEDAEARRQQELGMRMNKVIESLTLDMEAMGQQEEELRQFAASHTLFIKDVPVTIKTTADVCWPSQCLSI